jgi:hypothetical protein
MIFMVLSETQVLLLLLLLTSLLQQHRHCPCKLQLCHHDLYGPVRKTGTTAAAAAVVTAAAVQGPFLQAPVSPP